MTTEATIDGSSSDRGIRRGHLLFFLVPMAVVFAGAQIGRAIWPTLLDTAPWALLVLSSAISRIILVQPLVPAEVFFGVAFARIMLLAPLYYGFGSAYGDAGLRWGERKLGPGSRFVPALERSFRRYRFVIVALWWGALMCMMAGATGMRARVFFPVLAAGTAMRVTLVYLVGDALARPITEFADFVGRYALIITPITIAITALQLWHAHRRHGGLTPADVEDLEAGFEATETELEAEATVTGPRQPD